MIALQFFMLGVGLVFVYITSDLMEERRDTTFISDVTDGKLDAWLDEIKDNKEQERWTQ